MVLAILTESELTLSDEEVESIVNKVLHIPHFIFAVFSLNVYI